MPSERAQAPSAREVGKQLRMEVRGLESRVVSQALAAYELLPHDERVKHADSDKPWLLARGLAMAVLQTAGSGFLESEGSRQITKSIQRSLNRCES